MVKTGKEREELVEQDVKPRTLQKTETYILLLRNNNKRGRKPSRIYKGNNMKMWDNKHAYRCYKSKEWSWKRGYKGYAKVIWGLSNGCPDIWNENMVIYKTSGDERNRKDTRKSTKKDISTSTFNKLYCYHNENRNIASRVKDPICYDDTLS